MPLTLEAAVDISGIWTNRESSFSSGSGSMLDSACSLQFVWCGVFIARAYLKPRYADTKSRRQMLS